MDILVYDKNRKYNDANFDAVLRQPVEDGSELTQISLPSRIIRSPTVDTYDQLMDYDLTWLRPKAFVTCHQQIQEGRVRDGGRNGYLCGKACTKPI